MGRLKEKTLTTRLMVWVAVIIGVILLLSIPVLYLITTTYYAEDLLDLVEEYAISNPDIDIERDTIVGLSIQFFGILACLGVAIFLVMRYVPRRLWQPFYHSLKLIRGFKVEQGVLPKLPESNIKEFNELNSSLTTIMANSLKSYRVQKEFTENASHELQTPIAVAQSKLDNLLQDENLTEQQAESIRDIYTELNRMSRLSRNLLLLSRIDNNQYQKGEHVNLPKLIETLLPRIEGLVEDLKINVEIENKDLSVECNSVLLESMLSNLVVNAVRHNKAGGMIGIIIKGNQLIVSNTSDEPEMNPDNLFSRFHSVQKGSSGYGLGLSIVKSICDYHGWKIEYSYADGVHSMTVSF